MLKILWYNTSAFQNTDSKEREIDYFAPADPERNVVPLH